MNPDPLLWLSALLLLGGATFSAFQAWSVARMPASPIRRHEFRSHLWEAVAAAVYGLGALVALASPWGIIVAAPATIALGLVGRRERRQAIRLAGGTVATWSRGRIVRVSLIYLALAVLPLLIIELVLYAS